MTQSSAGSKTVAGALAALAAVGFGVLTAPTARADNGCESVNWGLFGSQIRTICDAPVNADGSWLRGRVIWTPPHQMPLTCYTYGGVYWSSTSCTGGYQVGLTVQSKEDYLVTPDTVLPDEPGWLAPTAAPAPSGASKIPWAL